MKLKTMVKRNINQKIRLRNFDARHGRIETGAVVKSPKGKSGIERGQGVRYLWKAKGQCSRGRQCSFWHDGGERAKSTPKTAPPSEPPTPRGRSASRKRRLRGRSPSGKTDRQPCLNRGVNSAQSAHFRTGRMRNNPTKNRRNDGDKSAVAFVKSVRQLGYVAQDAEPPESATISRKSTTVLGPIQRVRFTRAALRQANIRDNTGPSLGKIQVKSSHRRSPCAVKFEDRSQEETERQERCARGDAWRLAKHIFKLKGKEKIHSFRQPMSGFCQPHPQ